MRKFKLYFITFILAFGLFVSSHILPLIIIDPLNILNFDLTENEFFIKEMRFQTAPIINKFEFDSAIVGTSMAENFSAKEADFLLGGTFQNLSMSGSLLLERKIILEYLILQKEIKTIVISIDNATAMQRNKGIPISSWSFLYNKSYLDDLLLYTNRKYSPYINCHSLFNMRLYKTLYGECPKTKIRKGINELTEWQSNPKHNKRFGGIEKWLKHKNNSQIFKSIYDIKIAVNLIKNNKTDNNNTALYSSKEFSANIIPIIKKNPQIRFILFFPPYSIYKYAIDAQTKPHIFQQYKNLVKNVVIESSLYPNIEIYWFGNKKFVKNIKNYKDITHYNGSFNSSFLRSFSNKKSIINIENYNNYLIKLEKDANLIDLIDFLKKLK